MLSTAKIVCFLATTDADAAKHFYEEVLGLNLIEDARYALVFDANGTMLRIQKVGDHTPPKHTSLGWEVDDVRSEIAQLMERGVNFEQYDGLPQDKLGVWESPLGAEVAWFKDPDGNTLSLTEWRR